MKLLLIASAICGIIYFFLGIAAPMALALTDKGKNISMPVLLLYMGIVVTCVVIIVATALKMANYTPIINKLEKELEDAQKEHERLLNLIRHYNKLITEITNK